MAAAAYPPSYYAASANPAPERPALAGDIAPEICIVGAGFTGLSAGLDLAEKGRQVVVLEAARVGWGASGRNGGQIVNGLNASLERIDARYGARVADFVGTLVQEGGRIIRERVAKYAIACDLKPGNVFAAFTPKQMRALEATPGALAAARPRQLRAARPRRASAATSRARSTSAACSTAPAATCTR